MPIYSIEGRLGTGKTKFAVWRAQQALAEGRRVASNVDLNAHVLVPSRRCTWTRIPDKPTAADLEAVGHGNADSYDEERNGVMILDELATWLNSRSFQDKGRSALIDWLVHARKLGWDVYLIVQSRQMIDKQVRELIEYDCVCRRLDRMQMPIIGKLLHELLGRAFGIRWGYLPKMHTVSARFADVTPPLVAERWMYRGDYLHAAYDTRQVFRSDYPHGVHSVLPPWDFEPRKGWRATVRAFVDRHTKPVAPVRPLKPKRPEVEALASLSAAEAWEKARALASGHAPVAAGARV